jgi:hypothetical protein
MVVIYNRVALWPVTPMATPMATVKWKGNLNCCWYLLMTWRSHLTWFGFEDSYTEVRTLPTLCYVFWRCGRRSQSFDYSGRCGGI